ncbi:hypothetical protein SOVF_154780 [Spinacia oleracea]|uniref:UPF0496 protein At4g34320 n=1 Tax=Spinacia oleracea TaxID=3562 RepID=A0A9R0JV95_SPIOL|nr:UPF0496 protein At4g34320-like [Spinacia oleracea]KNA09312.1 hypothetical protein SOVF_154780 [Spinacia oleracea]
MGSIFSKKRSKIPTTPSTSNSNSSGGSNSVTSNDLNFYLAACKQDPDVKIFDSKLQQHATAVINTMSTSTIDDSGLQHQQQGQQVCSLSFDSITQVTGSLMDMNYEVVKVILDCKKDVWKNKELLSLVEDYFEYSVKTLDFFTALDQCLKRARDRHFIIQVALRRFEEEIRDNNNNNQGFCSEVCDKFSNTLQELRSFKEAGDPFGQEFFTLLQSVYTQQVQMLRRLQLRKRKLDKKLKSVKVYRKVSNIIFGAAFVAVVICSVVAAAIAAPPIASALAAAVSAPIGGVGKWFNSLWKKYERELKGERDLVFELQLGTYIAVKDLDNIRVLVEKLEIVIDSLLSNADFAIREVDTLPMVIDEIRKKLSVFMEGIDCITAHSGKYSREIRQARSVILHWITKYPSAPI